MKRGLFASHWHREVSEKVFLRALYIKFSHFPIRCIANMSFSYFCVYFRFKYSPIVNSTMVYEKRSIYVFLASRSFGESVSQSTLYQIFTFSQIMYCKHVIFTFLSVFPFQIYPLVNSNMVYEKSLFTSFWHREVSGKVFLRALYIKFSPFPIRCIANMSFSHFVYISVSNIYPLVNSNMLYEKGSIYVSLASRSFGESVS